MPLDAAGLSRLFNFLERNRTWNESFQALEYRRAVAHCNDAYGRLVHLLHSTVNSQNQPKMRLLGDFWRRLDCFEGQHSPSLNSLTTHLERAQHKVARSTGPWDRLFHALAGQEGWGPKTSALFVKNIIAVHRGPRELHFLSDTDVAKSISEKDRIYLPVDAVIQHIFSCLGQETLSFSAINRRLLAEYSPEQMLTWDDLWFWGFFTQLSDGETRTFGWNLDKFWCQTSAPKTQVADVERLALEFVRICTGRESG